ncbi:hypothetical protein A0H81_07326 [Grifola frondosa]|uniref:Uncharacterized protein n=1 Tax=Grifola frondosa TaxID=5627 RepID=A0A1C7M8F3_GRIFR|nr:hypothetical protein A0H81_07326 [Grifola frondosa]
MAGGKTAVHGCPTDPIPPSQDTSGGRESIATGGRVLQRSRKGPTRAFASGAVPQVPLGG